MTSTTNRIFDQKKRDGLYLSETNRSKLNYQTNESMQNLDMSIDIAMPAVNENDAVCTYLYFSRKK